MNYNNLTITTHGAGPILATLCYTPTPPELMNPRERHEDRQEKRQINKQLNWIKRHRPQTVMCLK